MAKDYKYILQENMFDCGVACLKTIFLQFGKTIKTKDIVENRINQGLSALYLINASKKLGIEAKGIKGKIENLSKNYLPCIAHVIKDKNYYHYIVVFENNFKKKELIIFDPTSGIETITYNEFKKISTQIYLVFNNNKFKKEKDKRFITVLMHIMKTNKRFVYKSLFLSAVVIGLSLIFNYYLKLIVSYNTNYKYIIVLSILFLMISLIKNVFEYIRDKIIINLNKNIDKQIKNKFFEHILNLPYSYYSNKSIGELVVITNDVENFKTIVTKIFIMCMIDSFIIVFILIFISFYSILYLIILLFLILITIYMSLKYQIVFNNKYLKLKVVKIKESSFLIESLKGINSIKNLNMENKVIEKTINNTNKTLEKESAYDKSSNNYTFINNALLEIFYIVIICVASLISIRIGKNYLDIILFSSIYFLFISFLTNINDNISLVRMYKSSIIKVLEIFEEEKENHIKGKNKHFKSIVFNKLEFGYTNEKVLKNINLEINSKDKVFIYGKSGSGKSTLINLLLKNINNYGGSIKINNTNIKNMDKSSIVGLITLVSQNEYLFNDSILNNMLYINTNKKEIEKSMKNCLVNEFLIKKGITENYVLEENGTNISGGERKKLLIARALLKNSKVLVLDESFNEIDHKEEEIIIKNIINNYSNLTIILISHRLNNKHLFNKSYELEEGVLKERSI